MGWSSKIWEACGCVFPWFCYFLAEESSLPDDCGPVVLVALLGLDLFIYFFISLFRWIAAVRHCSLLFVLHIEDGTRRCGAGYCDCDSNDVELKRRLNITSCVALELRLLWHVSVYVFSLLRCIKVVWWCRPLHRLESRWGL